jgi:molecular chaperone GrpE
MNERRRPNGEVGAAADAAADAVSDGAASAPEAPQTAENVQADLARLKGEADRNWQQFLRAAADLENYRKQAVRQREEAVASTRRSMLMVILGVMDTLERAIAHAGASANAAAIADGIRLAHRQVLDRLAALGVRPMETIGQPFDPRVHEAVDAVPASDNAPAGTVVDEVQRGYFAGDDVLRPARVRVAQ